MSDSEGQWNCNKIQKIWFKNHEGTVVFDLKASNTIHESVSLVRAPSNQRPTDMLVETNNSNK